jgi:3-deoxy-D-manno-octulosonate 8-phosphate phosphatase KdsC-like HAD superfamily phosphatase
MQNNGPEKLKDIQLLLLDVDGVLTDGRIIYDDVGSRIKEFKARQVWDKLISAEEGCHA